MRRYMRLAYEEVGGWKAGIDDDLLGFGCGREGRSAELSPVVEPCEGIRIFPWRSTEGWW